MNDDYKKLSNSLLKIMLLLENFYKSKNDEIKLNIRPLQTHIVSISKGINEHFEKKAAKLSSDIDNFLSYPPKITYEKLIEDALKLQEELFEI